MKKKNNKNQIMAQIIEQPTFSVSVTTAIEQLRSGQDYICKGNGKDVFTGELFSWVMLNDGHGTDSCINFIRSIPEEKKSEIMGTEEPIHTLVQHIEQSAGISIYESSGATAIIVKIYADRAICINCGDSQFLVFKNEELIHISKEHTSNNEKEKERIIGLGHRFIPSKGIKVISETEMIQVYAEYAIFHEKDQLGTTQALGHNSKTGYAPDTFIVNFEKDSSYRIMLGSDGIFDMTMLDNPNDILKMRTNTSQEICDWIVGRWKQEWIGIVDGIEQFKFSYSNEHMDDVSVSVIEIKSV
jgi:serine/threonine protein phosphatase PrpC